MKETKFFKRRRKKESLHANFFESRGWASTDLRSNLINLEDEQQKRQERRERLTKENSEFEDLKKLPCYAIMPYSKVMAKEDFMTSLYKNRMNLTIQVLDLCMHAFASVRNQLK